MRRQPKRGEFEYIPSPQPEAPSARMALIMADSILERKKLRETGAPKGRCGHFLALHADEGQGPCRMKGCQCAGEDPE